MKWITSSLRSTKGRIEHGGCLDKNVREILECQSAKSQIMVPRFSMMLPLVQNGQGVDKLGSRLGIVALQAVVHSG